MLLVYFQCKISFVFLDCEDCGQIHYEAAMSEADLRNRAGGDTVYCLKLQGSCTCAGWEQGNCQDPT